MTTPQDSSPVHTMSARLYCCCITVCLSSSVHSAKLSFSAPASNSLTVCGTCGHGVCVHVRACACTNKWGTAITMMSEAGRDCYYLAFGLSWEPPHSRGPQNQRPPLSCCFLNRHTEGLQHTPRLSHAPYPSITHHRLSHMPVAPSLQCHWFCA